MKWNQARKTEKGKKIKGVGGGANHGHNVVERRQTCFLGRKKKSHKKKKNINGGKTLEGF